MHGRILSETLCGTVVVSEIAYADDARLREHRHDRAYVSVLLDGAYTELEADLPRACTPGTAIAHAAHEVHADYFAARGRCVNLKSTQPGPLDRAAMLRAVRATFPLLERSVAALLREAHDGAPEPEPEPDWLRGVLREFGWVEPVRLDGAARLAGMHPAHFARAFRRHIGMTPSRYRRRERVRVASRLLLGSGRSLADVAHECGFTDQSHLTNVFRETAGVTPKRYRAAFAR
ncbi:MAG TPA: helix-turn-helix transcriptional regulator [Candidatus Elarobacter sp.]